MVCEMMVKFQAGTSMVVQWLRLCAPNAGAWVPWLLGN